MTVSARQENDMPEVLWISGGWFADPGSGTQYIRADIARLALKFIENLPEDQQLVMTEIGEDSATTLGVEYVKSALREALEID